MTVGDLIALLTNISDHTIQVVFKDTTGGAHPVTVTVVGQVDHLQPAQPSDPAYVVIQES